MPGQFGPIRRDFFSFRILFTRIMSITGMPSVMQTINSTPASAACNRRELDGAVSIHAVERFLGDLALRNGWKVPVTAQPSGKRVLVVGAGPGGCLQGIISSASVTTSKSTMLVRCPAGC
jgi:hypothetical protein